MVYEICTDTSSLRTVKIMPRNLNEIVRSWIRLHDSLSEFFREKRKYPSNKHVYNKLAKGRSQLALTQNTYTLWTLYSNLYVYCINFHTIVAVKLCFGFAAKRTAHTKSKTRRITSRGFSLRVAQFHSHIQESFTKDYIAQKKKHSKLKSINNPEYSTMYIVYIGDSI